MPTREQVEEEMRHDLATEASCIRLCNKPFTPDGLFSHLTNSLEERRVLVRSPVFRQALQRVHELQQVEVAGFARIADEVQAAFPGGGYLLKLEQTERQ